MITVAHLSNPFEPYKSKVIRAVEIKTISDAKKLVTGDAAEFTFPTICLLNGKAVMRREWEKPILKQGDVVGFAAVPGDVVSIIIAIVVAVIASIVVASLAKVNPARSTQTQEPDSVYNLSGEKNQVRLGYPIEVPYGRCHLWPSYAAKVYNQYIDNDQWQYQLFCLGQGFFQIHELRIDDTLLSQFQDIEYEIYEPGDEVTLFPNNVTTSVEVSGIELFGPNEDDYASWVGGYVANSAFTSAFKLECDVVLPNGLYYSNDKGGLDERTIQATFESRAINDAGTPIGGWILLFNFSHTNKTTTPQRFTLSATLAPGRYEVRARRTNNKDTSSRAGNTLQWESLRAFMEKTDYFGNVTLLAVKARASNNLNNQSSNRFNVTATRKVPTWTAGGGWSAPVATRNPVWAFCDVFRATYGGQLSETYLNLTDLKDLADELTETGDAFDYVFDSKTTVWDAAQTIGRACRSTATLQGSSVVLIRDVPKSVPVAVFTPDNIIEGSFKWEVKLSTIEEFDGLEVMYQDEDTEEEETILCVLPGEEGLNPDNVRLPGVTKRAQAYREGMYLRASERYSRENVIFRTGYEGLIPTVGDLIAVSHDVPRWGASGFVESIVDLTVTLDTAVVFVEGQTHQLVVRKKDGSAAGPYTVAAGATPYELLLSAPIAESFHFDSFHEPTYFLFGVSNLWSTLCKVSTVAPAEDEEVEITAVVYNSTIYSFDELEPPALEESNIPSAPNLPVVYGLNVAPVIGDPTRARATWNAALGAQSYLIQTSSNGINWNSVARVVETNYTFNVPFGVLYVRVAAINLGAGPWATWTGSLGVASTAPGAVAGLTLVSDPFVDDYFEVSWTAASGAVSYEIKIYQATRTIVKRTAVAAGTTFTYEASDAAEDVNPRHAMSIGVAAINAAGTRGAESFLDVANPIPAILTGFSLLFLSDTGTARNYRVGWTANTESDLAGYKIWVSATSGFTPGDSTLVYDGLANTFDIAIATTGGVHPSFYYRVAAYDAWGVGDGYNMSAEQTLPQINILKNSGNTLVNNDGDTLKG